MSFTITIRQGPAALARGLPKLARSTALRSGPAGIATRAFHQATPKTRPLLTARTGGMSTALTLRNTVARRSYQQQATHAQPAAEGASPWRKIIIGGAIFGGTMIATNAVLNRETREDGGMPIFEREYLNNTFLHTGLGIGMIALSARQMIRTGFVYRLMMTSPWVVAIGGIGLSIGSMMVTRSIAPDNYIPKYLAWTAFNVTQAAFVAPLLAFAPPALIARAGLYTVAMMGGLSFVGATAKQEKYLYIGGPLMAGAAIVLASGFAPMIIPATAVRTLALTESVWLYGGLALFGGFTLYDVQKVLYHARLAERGAIRRDPVNESISLELDFLNIFIRMVQILMMQNQRRK